MMTGKSVKKYVKKNIRRFHITAAMELISFSTKGHHIFYLFIFFFFGGGGGFDRLSNTVVILQWGSFEAKLKCPFSKRALTNFSIGFAGAKDMITGFAGNTKNSTEVSICQPANRQPQEKIHYRDLVGGRSHGKPNIGHSRSGPLFVLI